MISLTQNNFIEYSKDLEYVDRNIPTEIKYEEVNEQISYGGDNTALDEKYEEIIRFAELEDFQDRAFKHLSSGMKSRLAFSVASLVRPDILILDEVLSVGDGSFRRKSETKMKEIIESGATTILVSHSLDQVRAMCTKILWLNKGQQIAFSDDVDKILDDYIEFLSTKVLPDYAPNV